MHTIHFTILTIFKCWFIPSTLTPDQTDSLCRDCFWNFCLRSPPVGRALSLPWRCCWCLLGNTDAPASEGSPGRAQGKQQVAVHSVCPLSWLPCDYSLFFTLHRQCGSFLSPSSKLRFTSLKQKLLHC